MEIRPARPADLTGITLIYNHYVTASHVTFDVDQFSVAHRVPWFARFDGLRYQCLVAVEGSNVVGYACSTEFKPKTAYETSVEVSVYLDRQATGQGLGTRLYSALFAALSDRDVHRAYAGIALPNPGSIALHEQFGFKQVSHLTEVGRKFGKYWDVVWLEKPL